MGSHPNEAIVRSAYRAVLDGDLAGFAGVLDDDIVWHESMPGFAGDYHGRDEALGLLGRVFEETGLSLEALSIDYVLADDSHAAVLLETTVTVGGRERTSRYVDVYRISHGRLTEHWHLPIDPAGEEEFYAGNPTEPDESTKE